MIERVTVPGVEDLMCMNRRWKILGALFLTLFLLGSFLVWNIGSVLMAPANHPIGAPPASLHAEPVEFPSASGAQLHGWRIAGQPGKGVVVLLTGASGRPFLSADALIIRSNASRPGISSSPDLSGEVR